MPAVTSESLMASLIGSCRVPWRPFAGPTRLLVAAPRATTGRLYARAEGNWYFFLARRPTIRYPPRNREISRAPAACRAAYARGASMWEIIFWLFLWICISDISYYIVIISFCVYFRCDRQAVRGRSPPGEDARPHHPLAPHYKNGWGCAVTTAQDVGCTHQQSRGMSGGGGKVVVAWCSSTKSHSHCFSLPNQGNMECA